jgi:hypothetical protein
MTIKDRRWNIGTIWRELTPLLELKEDEATAPRLREVLKRLRA